MELTEQDFPSRIGQGTEAEARYVKRLLDRLVELAQRSHPTGGAASEHGKDHAAYLALMTAGDLVRVLAGWAVDHQVGLAMAGMSPLPLGPLQTRPLPEFEVARAKVDTHSHEQVGGSREEGAGLAPSVSRLVAINMLHANPGAMPTQVARDLEDALRALEINDVRPILRASPQNRKVTFDERRLQLQAVCFMHFRRNSRLMNAAKAQKEVAEAYAVSAETVRTWEKRLREELGYLPVSQAIGFAKNKASWIAEEPVHSKAIDALEGDPSFGTAALHAAAAQYRSRDQTS